MAEVAEVTSVGEKGGAAMNRVFAPAPGGDPGAAFRLLPQNRRPFEDTGIDLGFLHDAAGWTR